MFVKEHDVAIGWEGCFALPENANGKEIEIHANWGNIGGGATTGNTASTGKKDDGYSEMSLGCKGGSYGDPHLHTWMGMVYDFHCECDLVLLKSPSFDNGQGLYLHIRTQWLMIGPTCRMLLCALVMMFSKLAARLFIG